MRKNKLIFFGIILVSMLIYIPRVNAMKIFVVKPSTEKITIEVETSDTIEVVKKKIHNEDNELLPEKQKLIFDGRVMEEGRTLADYNIQKNNTIQLELIIKVIFDANGGTFDGKTAYTIDNWDATLYDNLKTPERVGYIFKGYYTEKTGGTKFEMILNESGIDSDMTFYAQWNQIVEKITVDFTNIINAQDLTDEKLDAFNFLVDKGLLKMSTSEYKVYNQRNKELFTVDQNKKIILADDLTTSDNIIYTMTESDIKEWSENDKNIIPKIIEVVFSAKEPSIPEENPNTYDGVGSSILLGIISLIVLVASLMYLKKRNRV